MKLSTLSVALASLVSATPVDMTLYKPGSNVDIDFGPFVKEYSWPHAHRPASAESVKRTDFIRYYRVSEDKTATASFTDFWPSDGVLIAAGTTFKGSASMLGLKQSLLPPNGNKAWWHLIEGANVLAEDAKTKTINAKIIIQTTYTPGNCSQAQYVTRYPAG